MASAARTRSVINHAADKRACVISAVVKIMRAGININYFSVVARRRERTIIEDGVCVDVVPRVIQSVRSRRLYLAVRGVQLNASSDVMSINSDAGYGNVIEVDDDPFLHLGVVLLDESVFCA